MLYINSAQMHMLRNNFASFRVNTLNFYKRYYSLVLYFVPYLPELSFFGSSAASAHL